MFDRPQQIAVFTSELKYRLPEFVRPGRPPSNRHRKAWGDVGFLLRRVCGAVTLMYCRTVTVSSNGEHQPKPIHSLICQM